MRTLLLITALLTSEICDSQELDIFQNDTIYAKNKISTRTMFSVNGDTLQKKIVTYYNFRGQKIKQFWFWNGEKNFHNVATFNYSNNGLISSLIDTSSSGKVEITTFYYDNNNLLKRVTLNGKDTSDLRSFPNQRTTIECWYMAGRPYRFDTTLFEKENVKLEYWGSEISGNTGKVFRWHYNFTNEFDEKGNLVKVSAKVESPYKSFTRYIYDEKGLLITKQEIILIKKKETIQMQYYFSYE